MGRKAVPVFLDFPFWKISHVVRRDRSRPSRRVSAEWSMVGGCARRRGDGRLRGRVVTDKISLRTLERCGAATAFPAVGFRQLIATPRRRGITSSSS